MKLGATQGLALEIDPTLVEEAARRELFRRDEAGDFQASNAYETARQVIEEPGLDGSLVSGALAALHARTFEELGLASLLREHFGRHPIIEQSAGRVLVLPARRRVDEGADLFRPDPAADPMIAVRLCAETIVDRGRLGALLRRELTFIADMLDPGFGYDLASVDRDLVNGPRPLRDRYMALWTLSVEARLFSEEPAGPSDRLDTATRSARQAFASLPDGDFAGLVEALRPERMPTHARILALAVRGLPDRPRSDDGQGSVGPSEPSMPVGRDA